MRKTAVILMLFCAVNLFPQQIVKIDGAKSAVLMEVGAIVSLDNKKLIVENVMGKEIRDEKNKKADIQKGDEILYINGTKVTDPKELRKIYDGVKPGAEIKLGVDRKGNKFFVAFTKGDKPAGQVMRFKSGADGKIRDENGKEIKGNVIKTGGKSINIDSLAKSGKTKIITK